MAPKSTKRGAQSEGEGVGKAAKVRKTGGNNGEVISFDDEVEPGLLVMENEDLCRLLREVWEAPGSVRRLCKKTSSTVDEKAWFDTKYQSAMWDYNWRPVGECLTLDMKDKYNWRPGGEALTLDMKDDEVVTLGGIYGTEQQTFLKRDGCTPVLGTEFTIEKGGCPECDSPN
ncbi:hypothetical protein CYMTET_41794 [Cymbomonas tetramitiformis]|uniref:Uncharacterized protein n=1 Tax=Cymbomonas tetramitiformis TaxID=36881 RepID=A0AAE0F256_9CHLO|nr:hypothetical protein CYMTET_41794 [Cymbomonas tetramitiformis]